MPDKSLATVCGLYCGTCRYHGNGCEGCSNVRGKPFWTELLGIGACPIYDCCVNTRHHGHCGQCSELLCDRYDQVKDPEIPDQQIEAINRDRRRELIRRAERERAIGK